MILKPAIIQPGRLSFKWHVIFIAFFMNKIHEPDIVPVQKEGKETNIEYSISLESRESAQKTFKSAYGRLLLVNDWESICGSSSANFSLTDHLGYEITRSASEGDHFKIDIPGPGSVEGRGYDWVRIEKIEEHIDCEKDIESIAMRVRPAPNPKTPGEKIAHFFKDDATSSFVVTREGNKVTAAIYGRNEKPNTGINNLIDKVRNTVIAISALAGISSMQWENLAKGLIEGKKE